MPAKVPHPRNWTSRVLAASTNADQSLHNLQQVLTTELRTPESKKLQTLVESTRRALQSQIEAFKAEKAVPSRDTREDRRRNSIGGRPTRELDPAPPKVSAPRRPVRVSSSTLAARDWNYYVLERIEGEKSTSIIRMFEQPLPPSDAVTVRLWCREIFEEAPWSRVEGDVDQDAIRIDFPPNQYYGLPQALLLERPNHYRLGGLIRLRGDGKLVVATYRVRAIDRITTAQLQTLEARMEDGR